MSDDKIIDMEQRRNDLPIRKMIKLGTFLLSLLPCSF